MEVKININGNECYIVAKSSDSENCIKEIDKYESVLYQSITYIIDSVRKSGNNFKSVMLKLAIDE